MPSSSYRSAAVAYGVLAVGCLASAVLAANSCYIAITPSCCWVAVGGQPDIARNCGGTVCGDWICPGGNPVINDVAKGGPGKKEFVAAGSFGCKWNSAKCHNGICSPAPTTIPCSNASNCYSHTLTGAECP